MPSDAGARVVIATSGYSKGVMLTDVQGGPPQFPSPKIVPF